MKMKTLMLSAFVFLALFVVFTPVIINANYITGLDGNTWINITITAYNEYDSVWEITNVTGYLKDLAPNQGVTQYYGEVLARHYDGSYWRTWYLDLYVKILNLNNTFDVLVYLDTTKLGYVDPSYQIKYYQTVIPVYSSENIIATYLDNKTWTFSQLSWKPAFANQTIIDNDSSYTELSDAREIDVLLSGFSQTAYNDDAIPKTILSLASYPDDSTTTTDPPTGYSIYHYYNDTVVYSSTDNKYLFPISEMIQGATKPVIFYPDLQKSLINNIMLKIYWNGLIYPRNYNASEIIDKLQYTYPSNPVYVYIFSETPQDIYVYSVANGLTADYAVDAVQHLFVANNNTLYYIAVGSQTQMIQATNGAQYYFRQTPIITISLPGGFIYENYSENIGLNTTAIEKPTLPYAQEYQILYLLLMYMIFGAIVYTFPPRFVWIGMGFVLGFSLVMKSSNLLDFLDNDKLFYASIFPPFIISIILSGVSTRK